MLHLCGISEFLHCFVSMGVSDYTWWPIIDRLLYNILMMIKTQACSVLMLMVQLCICSHKIHIVQFTLFSSHWKSMASHSNKVCHRRSVGYSYYSTCSSVQSAATGLIMHWSNTSIINLHGHSFQYFFSYFPSIINSFTSKRSRH